MANKAFFALIVFLSGCSQYEPVSFNKQGCEVISPAFVSAEVKRIVDPLYLKSDWSISSASIKATRLEVEAALTIVERCGTAERYQIEPEASGEEILDANNSISEWGMIHDQLGWLIFHLRKSEEAPVFIFGRGLWKKYYSDWLTKLAGANIYETREY